VSDASHERLAAALNPTTREPAPGGLTPYE
jgi:hypothetical protein